MYNLNILISSYGKCDLVEIVETRIVLNKYSIQAFNPIQKTLIKLYQKISII